MQFSAGAKWIVLTLLGLCAISVIVVPIVTHSIHNGWYGVAAALFLAGIYNILFGVRNLRLAQQNGKTVLWYKEFMIDLGIMSLLLGFLEIVIYGVGNNLSSSIGIDMTYGVTGILSIGALIFFILLIKYRPNKSSTS